MQKDTPTEDIVYDKNVIEFVTVVAETCLFLERTEEYTRNGFITQAVKLLPLLYLKANLVDVPESMSGEMVERFVSEEDYLFVREKIEHLLGNDNIYLEVFHPDMQYSDTPIAAFISEDLADIYQELKDFAANYSLGITDIMHEALALCMETFREHWGQKTLNALRALHSLRYNEDFNTYEENDQFNSEENASNRNSFLDYLRDSE